MPKFKLPKHVAVEGPKMVAGHVFMDGVLEVSTADALKLERILVRFHECELVVDEVVQTAEIEKDPKIEPTIAAKETKAAK